MKESEKELLELAAKAAGIVILRSRLDNPICQDMLLADKTDDGHAIGWNPLEDDGDALRLAVKLKLIVSFADAGGGEHVCSGQRLGPFSTEPLLILHSDLAATRRAIVRAAAEIGKAMP